MKKLFIIGNGFDLAHDLKTSYTNFREYLEEQDWGYLEYLERMYIFLIQMMKKVIKIKLQD